MSKHYIQSAIYTRHYLHVHWKELWDAVELLDKAGHPEVAETLGGLMHICNHSVPDDFDGPLMQPNMHPGFPPTFIELDKEAK
jgi:hypothetical protein